MSSYSKQSVSSLLRARLTSSYREFSSTDLRTVGSYTLGRLIGKGSFGKVYLATHKLTNGSKVVLKSAKKDDSNLAREIHHHRQFTHPHIARLYEVIVTESLVWLVLEYCDELYHYLSTHGPLEPAKVQRIFTQLVGAVAYVHSRSCVHRDLKLENILLDKHENVKLVDFGFTREYEGKASYLQTWCGTVCYSAPEMLKGDKYAGEKVDVWSLGIILYALLCGELPFDEDDENDTKTKILKDEPNYPEHLPPAAKELILALLSKRPLLRPSLADILMNPWLAEHAPQQQAILKLQQPAPFTTELEKETLQRMRSAGVNIDQVIENVLAQRCDALAGWWTLLMEKEERKAIKRERKRKEREAESKAVRRLSAASMRLERMAPTIRETDEEGQPVVQLGNPPKARGRNMQRTATAPSDLPSLVEIRNTPEPGEKPVTPPDKISNRSASSSRHRPPVPPKENGKSRSSMLQVPDPLSLTGHGPKRRSKYQQPFFHQFAQLKHWFKESAKRAKSPNSRASSDTSPKLLQRTKSPENTEPISPPKTASNNRSNSHTRPDAVRRTSYTQRPELSTLHNISTNHRRPSHSPSPLTPRSSYRRSSAGLGGRKSTSSSVSSVRSLHHHHHSHSKASSTSSASLAASPAVSTTGKVGRSPHTSVKILPGTPTTSTFPSNIRVVRGPMNESSAAFGAPLPPPSPGLVFAKRKRSPFKGPMLGMTSHGLGTHGGVGGGHRVKSEGGSRSTSVQGRRSGEIIEEEDEDEVEEVDAFSPVGAGGEVVYMEELEEGPTPGSR
ncbi:CAMK/CAMKL protein kinase [Coniosporium apollinis CBS 100218]|uniref:CAMK/CAMKL protein kinase n=1 Tax=Coniosporium apollinis (strain CBS 100218) TaxID=1168221 RepID=R7YYD0_CONA1|nr:CAMK/CAMKL protein kinase [Coniosporium apollinis CBS 100218]EON66794.1 CAMK/CAMKL protein kinase [Coniosporium apollinis CBS 100218]